LESSDPHDRPTTQPTGHAISGLLLLALAAILLLCGLCSTAFYVIFPLTNSSSASSLETNTVFGATAGLGFIFGAILGWQGLGAFRQSDSIPAARAFPPVLAFVSAVFGAIFLGAGALFFQSISPYIFPPWHFLTGLLIPVVFISYAARRLGKSSGLRPLTFSFSWGALGATLFAFIAEFAIAAIGVIVWVVALAANPNGLSTLAQIRLQLSRLSQDPNELNRLIESPFAVTVILLYVAVLVPPIEEALKTLVVAFMDPKRMTKADAVLWGIAAGAGFGAFENLFNTATMLNFWVIVMVLRVGATIMHVANGAMMGRGWYAARVERKWGGLLIAYGVSVLFHALWNGAVILLSRSMLAFTPDANAAIQNLFAQGAAMIALLGVLGILPLLGLAWIAYATRTAAPNLQEAV
jgi:protease prsW family protein